MYCKVPTVNCGGNRRTRGPKTDSSLSSANYNRGGQNGTQQGACGSHLRRSPHPSPSWFQRDGTPKYTRLSKMFLVMTVVRTVITMVWVRVPSRHRDLDPGHRKKRSRSRKENNQRNVVLQESSQNYLTCPWIFCTRCATESIRSPSTA